MVDKDQAYFWAARWQEGEREAEADIRAGRVRRSKDARTMTEAMAREAR